VRPKKDDLHTEGWIENTVRERQKRLPVNKKKTPPPTKPFSYGKVTPKDTKQSVTESDGCKKTLGGGG